MNIYNKCPSKSYYFLVIDTTLASNSPLRFRKNLLEIIKKNYLWQLMIRLAEKLQYSINREVAKISAFSFGKIDKYEDLNFKWKPNVLIPF